MNRPSRSFVVVALAAVLVAVGVAAALGSSGGKGTKSAFAARRPVSHRLYRHIAALTRARRASADAHPLPDAVLLGVGRQLGLTPTAAVFVDGAFPSWIVPGSTEVCLMHGPLGSGGSSGGICGTIAAFEQRGLAEATETSSGANVVLGLVPDGNQSVEVTDSDGSTKAVPVTDNVYEITGGDPVSATLRDASGTTIARHLPVMSAPPPPSAPAG